MSNTLDGFTLDYKLKRVAFVNSASHYYSEIMLDNHLALFGDNNAGKTASLAALKLMLYPETDFAECFKKFKFQGKTGKYSTEDSYNFYFPCDQSFLIMEIESHNETSCIVLYRAKGYKYNRWFMPTSYDEIRSLFFDEATKTQPEDLSVAKLSGFAKQYKNSIEVTDSKKLVELMYGNVGREDSRYCIVPLMENNRNAVNAFRNIFQMAFDSGSEAGESLSEAIATLIEMKHSRREEKLSADLAQLEQEYKGLIHRGEELVVLSNNSDLYTNLTTSMAGLSELELLINNEYAVLNKHFISQNESYSGNYAQVNQDWLMANKDVKEAQEKITLITNKRSVLLGAISNIEDGIVKQQRFIDIAERVMSEHSKTDAHSLQLEMSKKLEVLNQELVALDNEEETAVMLAGLVKEQNIAKNDLRRAVDKEDNIESLILGKFSQNTSAALASINKDFTDLSADLSDDEMQVLMDFADLFETKEGFLAIGGEVMKNTPSLSYSLGEQTTKIKLEIKRLKSALVGLDERINAINTTLKDNSGESRRVRIISVSNEIKDLKTQIEALKRHDIAAMDIKVSQIELDEKLVSSSELLNQINEVGGSLTDLEKSARDIGAKRIEIQNQNDQFEYYETELRRIATTIEFKEVDVEALIENGLTITLNPTSIRALGNHLNRLIEMKAEFIPRVRGFVELVPNERIDRFKELHRLSDAKAALSSYSTSFSTLQLQKNRQAIDIASHNRIVGSQLKEISDAHRILETSVKDINNELNDHKISNLEKVSLRLHLHSDFEHVYKLSQNYDLSQDKLMGSDFYQSLLTYVQKHANKRTGLLKMKDIIKNITFEYLDATGALTEKPQSGGTTSTITASIISILLKRIFMANTTFKMPIVIDEVAALDGTNTAMIIECINEHGFSAFCATPLRSAVVCDAVGRWVTVDYNHIGDDITPVWPGCVLNILPGSISVWGVKPSDADDHAYKDEAKEQDDVQDMKDGLLESVGVVANLMEENLAQEKEYGSN